MQNINFKMEIWSFLEKLKTYILIWYTYFVYVLPVDRYISLYTVVPISVNSLYPAGSQPAHSMYTQHATSM